MAITVPQEFYDEWKAELQTLEGIKQQMLGIRLGQRTPPEKLANFADLGKQFDKSSAKCSKLAKRIADFNG
jgi:hypothetical protein